MEICRANKVELNKEIIEFWTTKFIGMRANGVKNKRFMSKTWTISFASNFRRLLLTQISECSFSVVWNRGVQRDRTAKQKKKNIQLRVVCFVVGFGSTEPNQLSFLYLGMFQKGNFPQFSSPVSSSVPISFSHFTFGPLLQLYFSKVKNDKGDSMHSKRRCSYYR